MNDLRFKGLKDQWMRIQDKRFKYEQELRQMLAFKKKVRQIAQELPQLKKEIDDLLDQYNKMMV